MALFTEIVFVIFDITKPSGTERAVVNLSNTLARHGKRVSVISIYSKEGLPYYAIDPSINIIHLNRPATSSLLKRVLVDNPKTVGLINKYTQGEKKIIVSTSHGIGFMLSRLKGRNPLNRYLAWENLAYDATPGYSNYVRKWLYKKLDGVVVLTEGDQKKYYQLGINKCHVIPYEVSFYPDQTSTCLSKELLAVGRYTHQKGFDILIDMVEKPLKKFPEWTLSIVGDGEMKELLINKIKEKNLEKQVQLVPYQKNIIDCYLRSSLFLLSSRYEGLPFVLLEARACGLPVVAFDCPTGPKDVIKPNDGILVNLYDEDSFAKGMEELMADEKKRVEFGRNARKDTLKYNSDSIYEKWKTLFNNL
ncbi:glycosyltransferase family 4 protein [Niastella sp. OAS944]|uniref:glycosyltransferase family 4 protein n=1 Tax=Niastella sp. OAS944 TaxID=2664089 RepID=UPI003495D517|nr:glycosyltransferase involved in cell wall biosynthesis [Chitinophagaceae bacterium OAS944]